MKEKINILLSYIFVVLIYGGILWAGVQLKAVKKARQISKPYLIEIKNEHHVQCVSGRDTINLYFENAYNLAEERLVFIEQ